VLFGELRSLLSEAGSEARFEALVGVLSRLRREAPERFEAEVLPYASAGLERWYAGQTYPLQYALRGRVAVEALRADVSWLQVVRALDLSEERKAGAALDALLACTQLTQLELLMPPDQLSSAGMRRLVSSPLMSRLAALRLWGREIGGELEAWAAAPPERLRGLELWFCRLDERIMAPLLALSGQLERLELDHAELDGASRLLREGSWAALRSLGLHKQAGRGDCEALTELMRRASLESLTAREVRWQHDVAAELWRAGGLAGLKKLIISTLYGVYPLSLDALLSAPLASSLETLEIQRMTLTSDAAPGRCPRLASLLIKEASAATVRWMMAHELPALRTLELNAIPDEALLATMADLCDARRKLDKLTLWPGRGLLNDAASSALVWRAARALDLETLYVYLASGETLEPHAVALMRDTIEQLPRLTSLHISPDALSPAALELLRGSHAAALLKL
jgi:hypothetical protein